LADKPYELKAEKPLVLRYGAALWDGQADRKEIEAVYQFWSKNKYK
jgi:hypothetical protein